MGVDHFNSGAGGSYARNLRMENEQLGAGQQQTGGLMPHTPAHGGLTSAVGHLADVLGAKRDDPAYAPMHDPKRDGPQGNIAASVYNSDNNNYDDSEPMSDEQKFPMMSMRRITKLPYIESGGEGMLNGPLGGWNSKAQKKASAVYVPPEGGFGVSRSLLNKQSDIENQPEYYGALKEHMREMGPENVAPIHVQPKGGRNAYGGGTDEHANLGNGGHRVAIAMELGWTHMRTTSDKGGSGYAEEDQYRKGMEGTGDSDDYYEGENEERDYRMGISSDHFHPGQAGAGKGEFGGAYARGGVGHRAVPTGQGSGGERRWARDPANEPAKQWGTGPIQEQNARIQGYGGGQRSDRRPGEGQQAMQMPRPVPNPYGSVSGEQFGGVKHKSLTSAIGAGDRAGQLEKKYLD